MSKKRMESKTVGYHSIASLPWEQHLFDPNGKTVVFLEPGQSFYSVSFNRFTNLRYQVYRIDQSGSEHRFSLNASAFNAFLADFPVTLAFGDDAYGERRAWRRAA